jgi:hypothetical protein
MEGLIQLVAATFIRHGIESPAAGDLLASPAIPPAEPILPTALPEHNYRRSIQSGILRPSSADVPPALEWTVIRSR